MTEQGNGRYVQGQDPGQGHPGAQGIGPPNGVLGGQGMQGQPGSIGVGEGPASTTPYGVAGYGQVAQPMASAGVPHGQYAHAPGTPYWPGYGYPPAFFAGQAPGMGNGAGPGTSQGQGMAQAMQEITGGSGLGGLGKLLDFDDKDFWKGALVGAAVVLLLTNDSVQNVLFRGAVKTRDAVKEGVDKVKDGVEKVKEQVRSAKGQADE